MLGPQSLALFGLLMVMFGALMWWMVAGHRAVPRVLAACLAFLSAMLFGVAAVNKYYGYYQTWGAVAADFTSQGVNAAPQLPDSDVGSGAPGGGHTMMTWRAEVSSMLKWMTQGLAQAAQKEAGAQSRPATDVAQRQR